MIARMTSHAVTAARRAATLLALVLAGACATAPPPGTEPGPSDWHVEPSRKGRFVVEWRAVPDPIPFNRPFELEVRLTDGADPSRALADAPLSVQALMPGHGHGMLRATRTTHVGDGLYRVEGMLFHMEGAWEVLFEVRSDAGVDRAVTEVRLDG